MPCRRRLCHKHRAARPLRELDQVLVVATARSRAAAEERIRAVDQSGKLARWHATAPARRRPYPLATPWRRARLERKG